MRSFASCGPPPGCAEQLDSFSCVSIALICSLERFLANLFDGLSQSVDLLRGKAPGLRLNRDEVCRCLGEMAIFPGGQSVVP